MTHSATRTEWTRATAAMANTTARRPPDGTTVAWRVGMRRPYGAGSASLDPHRASARPPSLERVGGAQPGLVADQHHVDRDHGEREVHDAHEEPDAEVHPGDHH